MNKREASLVVQNHGGCEKTDIHDFSSTKEIVFLSSPCLTINLVEHYGKQLIVKQCSVNEGHQDVEAHNPEDKVGGVSISTSCDFQHN
jgi:hypothetical protein